MHIKAGECILLCGKSGCGKTTVTKLVNGLIPHFTENGRLEGEVTDAGMAVAQTELYELSKRIGSVFQNPKSQFFNLDSDAELAFALENIGASPEYMRGRLKATVEELKIERLEYRGVFTISGGERQALAFASVYAMNPGIYVLDEPTANLDGDAIAILRWQLGEVKRQGKTILIAENRLYFLTDLIDRAVYKECFCVMQDVNHQLFCDSVWNECELSLPAGADNESGIEAVLRAFDLPGYKDRHPMALSGGQKQRAVIASALASRRELIVFGEPTSGLDRRHMGYVAENLRELRGLGKTLLVITHDPELILASCTHALYMEEGRAAAVYPLDNSGIQKMLDFFMDERGSADVC